MPRYIIELFDHKEHIKIIEYNEGTNEIDAVIKTMDKEIPEGYHTRTIDDLRQFYMNDSLQFVGVIKDPFVYKINTEGQKVYQKGVANEVSKSFKRSDSKKQKSNEGRNRKKQQHPSRSKSKRCNK